MWTTLTLLAVGLTACSIMGGASMTTVSPAASTAGPAGTSRYVSPVAVTTEREPNKTEGYTPLPVSAATNASAAVNVTTSNGPTGAVTTSVDGPTGAVTTSANATTASTGGATSKTSPPAGGGVPGWGIALLVLAAVLLGLLLLMLIAMMFWCCCNSHKHPDDIPLYTTHSRLRNADSAPAYEDVDKDVKVTE